MKDFKNWTKNHFPNLNQINSYENTAIILGMISLAVNKIKGYFLRNTQLVAILLFISKQKDKGLIEEISTGEGKSCIISSLAIYFALKGKKVDIISSSYTLAQRDSDEFRNLFDLFNLTTSYPYDSCPEPYRANILYGTFLEFEGDYLREVTTHMKIRNGRCYEVIIIDEVDNLFIDNILGSTQLVNSACGFKFLLPIYLTTYLSFELCDYFFLLYFKLGLKTIDDDELKVTFEKCINDPIERKERIIQILQGNMNQIVYTEKNFDKDKIKELLHEKKNMLDKKKEDFSVFTKKLNKYLEFPEYLKPFVDIEMSHWINSAYDAKNVYEIDKNYVEAINEKGNKDIAPVDRSNTGEVELSTVYGRGLHQMLAIKHKLRLKDENLTHTFL